MEQYANLGQLVWPGLVLGVIGLVLYTRKNVIAGAIGLLVGLTGLYYALLSIYVVDTNGAIFVVLVVMLLAGVTLIRTKGLNSVFGLIVCLIAGLGLFATASTYLPNFTGGQWVKEAIDYITVLVGQLLGLADQGLGQLKQ